MNFSFGNLPSTFQHVMNCVITGLEGCALYLYNVVVYSGKWEEHVTHIRASFERLVEAHLTVNIASATATYLGNVISYLKITGASPYLLLRLTLLSYTGAVLDSLTQG